MNTCTSWQSILEMIGIIIPSLLFTITGTVNFYKIRSIGFNRVVKYSKMFKLKLLIIFLLLLLNLCVIPRIILKYLDKKEELSNTRCIIEWFKLDNKEKARKYIIACDLFDSGFKIVALIGQIKLLIYLYRKGLSEFWYAHKLIWVLEMIMDFTIVLSSLVVDDFDYIILFEEIGGFLLNFFLVVLMIRTRRKEIEKPKPIYFDPKIIIIEEKNDNS